MSKLIITGDIYLGGSKVEELAENGNIDGLFGDFLPIIRNSEQKIPSLEYWARGFIRGR